jgi:hypothetical protein
MEHKRRRPVEAIEHRMGRSAECERRVRRALTKLTRTGVPFTVENVCEFAGVGKTFIYDKRRPYMTNGDQNYRGRPRRAGRVTEPDDRTSRTKAP